MVLYGLCFVLLLRLCVFVESVSAVCLCLFCVRFHGLFLACSLLWLSVFLCWLICVGFVCDLLRLCALYLIICVILSGAFVCVFFE